MIQAHFKLRTIGFIPGVPRWKSTLNKCLKAAWHVAGNFWHREYRPEHFTEGAGRRYGYTPSKGEAGSGVPFKRKGYTSYTARKLKEKGHTRPLVFEGDLERLARVARIVSTSKGVKVHLTGANKANFRHPQSQVNMREELTTVITSEVTQITRTSNRKLDAEIRGVRETHTTQTR